MCSLWTILDNNLKCIPPTMCKITHPQQIQPTGAFYEWGAAGVGFLFFSSFFLGGVAWNQIYGNTSTSVSELLRKYFEIKQLSRCQTWYVKRGRRRRPRRTGVRVWKWRGDPAATSTALTTHNAIRSVRIQLNAHGLFGLDLGEDSRSWKIVLNPIVTVRSLSISLKSCVHSHSPIRPFSGDRR